MLSLLPACRQRQATAVPKQGWGLIYISTHMESATEAITETIISQTGRDAGLTTHVQVGLHAIQSACGVKGVCTTLHLSVPCCCRADMQSEWQGLVPRHADWCSVWVKLLLLQVPVPVAAVPDLHHLCWGLLTASCALGTRLRPRFRQHHCQQL